MDKRILGQVILATKQWADEEAWQEVGALLVSRPEGLPEFVHTDHSELEKFIEKIDAIEQEFRLRPEQTQWWLHFAQTEASEEPEAPYSLADFSLATQRRFRSIHPIQSTPDEDLSLTFVDPPYIARSRRAGGIRRGKVGPGSMVLFKQHTEARVGCVTEISTSAITVNVWARDSSDKFRWSPQLLDIRREDLLVVGLELTQTRRLPADVKRQFQELIDSEESEESEEEGETEEEDMLAREEE